MRGAIVVQPNARGGFQRFKFAHLSRAWVALWCKPGFGVAIAFVEKAILANGIGPHLVGKDTRIGAQGHACVDERTATKSATNDDVHILANPNVE